MTADFELLRPASLGEAIALLDSDDPGVRPFSGGTALMLMMKAGVFAPSRLVDLTGIGSEHHAISGDAASGLRIGGLASLASIERDARIAEVAPVIPHAMKRLSNVRVRNASRIGGALAHGDPHMDMPPVLAALRADVVAAGPGGERRIAVEDLFAGYYETVLGQGEIVAAVELPPQAGWRSVYRKTTVRTHDDWPTLGVAVSLRTEGGTIAEARVMVSAATEKLTRLPEAEAALVGENGSDALFRSVAGTAARGVEMLDDAQGSAGYKKALMEVELRRALLEAIGETAR